MTDCPETRKADLAVARPLLPKRFMSTRFTMLLVGVLLSGCVGGGFHPRSYGGYSPVYGGGTYYTSAPYYGERYWYGNRDWYDSRYDNRYYGRSARELAEDQARARERLRRDQQERRDSLRERQQDRRENRQAEGTWRNKNARYQQQQRQNQQERFRREREEQRKRQDRAWGGD